MMEGPISRKASPRKVEAVTEFPEPSWAWAGGAEKRGPASSGKIRKRKGRKGRRVLNTVVAPSKVGRDWDGTNRRPLAGSDRD
jgi:hypothetical protein